MSSIVFPLRQTLTRLLADALIVKSRQQRTTLLDARIVHCCDARPAFELRVRLAFVRSDDLIGESTQQQKCPGTSV